jgi:peptidoglycan/xylan/chitin deacetylase (PgdA/CDA1 family)
MAKRKIVKKSIKKTRKVHKTLNGKSNINLKNALIVLFFLILLFLGLINLFESSKLNHPNFKKQLLVKPPLLHVKNIVSPTPSITPKITPTPVPLTGFCLHVPVLMYHHIQPEVNAKQLGQTALTVDSSIFDTQMQYLSQNGYTTFFANVLINALISHQNLPSKSVVITIDDGYEDNFIYALPILKKYGLKANIMLASGLMNNSNMLSWDEIKSLQLSGLIYFTNHTWSHYFITHGTQEKINYEIDTGKSIIEDHTGQTVNVFTYPYGSFNNNAISTLSKKGYIGAFTEIPGQYQCDSFLMTLHRTRIGNAPLSHYGL